ncbi:MAG: hypothetical protein WCD79_01865 [Chthoniobacteraceae bacterium]
MSSLRFKVALFTALAALSMGLQAGPVLREPGVIYLEDLLPKPVKIDVVQEAPIYFDLDFGRYLGVLKKGQLVELQALTDTAFRVKGQAQQGQVAGWVEPKYLGALKPDFIANLKRASQRQQEVKALIAKKEAAINMTPEEVIASLGKAGKTSSRLDAAGRHDVWDYIRYETVPQQTSGYDRFGNLVTNTIYVKVPAGKLSIIFDNNLVTALEQSDDNQAAKNGQTKIVATPIEVY